MESALLRHYTLIAASMLLASYASAESTHQPYKGFQGRDITTLSDQDIAALQAGSGWGLALPAELNGYPGPAHVLELARELGLSDIQKQRMTALFEAMRDEAITKGQALMDAERNLDAGFASGGLDTRQLRRLIDDAEAARADLRYVHLSRHLMTVEILDDHQIGVYAVRRGYTSDPCASVPEGHDASMWRRHNGCEDE